MLLLLLGLTAHAWDLEVQASIALPQDDAPAALVRRTGGAVLALATPDLVLLIDPLDPEEYEIVDLEGARALLGFDVDESGEDDVIVCTDAGLYVVAWGESLGEPVLVREQGCVALSAHEVYGDSAIAVHSAAGTELWDDLVDPEPASVDATALARPLLAPAGSSLGVAGLGEWTVRRLHSGGVEVLDAGGAVSGLTSVSDALAWSLGQEAQVVVGATTLDTGPHPGALAACDLDGDGAPHLVVGYPAALGLWDEGVEVQTVSTGMEPTRLLAGDLDGDGCEDLVVIGEELLTPWVVAECEDEPGDTGDTGEPEGCGGPSQMRIGVPAGAEEGDSATFAARPSGCVPDHGEVTWALEPADLAVCEEDGWTLRCGLLDDGTLTVGAVIRFPRHEPLEGSVDLDIDNVAPVIQGNGWVYWESVEGEPFTEVVVAEDVVADTVTWELDGDAPVGLEISADGVLTWEEPVEGWWWLQLTASDEDGGAAYMEGELYVGVDVEARRNRGLRRILGMCLIVFAAAIALVLIVLLGRPASLV